MVNVAAFNAQLDVDIARVSDEIMDEIKEGLRTAYSFIMEEWPKHTYYSAANHWVTRNRPKDSPVPAERPSYTGALADDAAIQYHNSIEFIDALKAPKRGAIVIHISNPVSYASDVGFITGQGEAIYEQAATLVEAELSI